MAQSGITSTTDSQTHSALNMAARSSGNENDPNSATLNTALIPVAASAAMNSEGSPALAEFDLSISKGKGSQGRGSSDEDNVSWLAPMGRFNMVCYAKGTPGHHRDLSAQTVLPFAERSILQTAKVFAGSAVDLFTQQPKLKAAQAEFRKKTRGFKYDPIIPKRQKVPVDPP